jgi:hypothetical protein
MAGVWHTEEPEPNDGIAGVWHTEEPEPNDGIAGSIDRVLSSVDTSRRACVIMRQAAPSPGVTRVTFPLGFC